jgi:predicted ABC-type ATPase
VPSANPEQPHLVIIAGPNGSGKTTAYQKADFQQRGRSVWIINPDALTIRIQQAEGMSLDAANKCSVDRIYNWLTASIEAHQSVGVETVLSTSKYRSLVEKAKALGFVVTLIYVILESPQLNIERVRMRVAQGGHDVPEEKIVARYARSLAELPWFLEHADHALLFDNSTAEPICVGEKNGEELMLSEQAPKALLEVLKVSR